MADILKWLIDSFANNSKNTSNTIDLIDSDHLPVNISSETDRILFVKEAATLLATNLNIKINTKKLYRSDVNCISELNKLSSILYQSMIEANNSLNQTDFTNLNQNINIEENDENTTL